MALKPASSASALPRKGAGTLAQLMASGIYQFKGPGGKIVTLVNKEKLRTATSKISTKGSRPAI